MKGIFSVNKWRFAKFCLVRVILTAREIWKPLLLVAFIEWLQDDTVPDTPDTVRRALCIGLLLPALQALQHTIWEHFCFDMIETGHRAHTALKTILFKKDLKMSAATNKDFTEGEISSIIMGDTNKIWDFIWQMPEFLEVPLVLVASCYYCFQTIGWYGLIVIAVTMAQFGLSYVRETTEKDIQKESREKSDKRVGHINESFQNIKGVKLYGWETKFLEKIEAIYQEESALKTKSETRNAVYDFVGGVLD